MKKQILRTLSMMIAMALLLTCLPVTAEETKNDGSLSITFEDKGYKGFKPANIQVAIYQIAKGEYGAWTMKPGFEDIGINTGKDGGTKITLPNDSMKSKIKGSGILPAVSPDTTDNKGNVSFSGLEHGIYLVMLVTNRNGLTMSPMLLAVPDKEGEVNVRAFANKYTFNKTETEVPPRIPPLVVTTKRGERLVPIDDYETALGLGNIQIHVGVCFE